MKSRKLPITQAMAVTTIPIILTITASLLAGCSSSPSTSTKSYQDGFAHGAAIASHYPPGQDSSGSCPSGLTVMPSGDNADEFQAGCVAGAGG